MNKIRKGDEVIVIRGKDKGRKGVVLSVIQNGQKLLVEGINSVKKHVKANPNTGERGGIVLKFLPLDRSKVKIFNSTSEKGDKVYIKVTKDGKRIRCFKSTNEAVDV